MRLRVGFKGCGEEPLQRQQIQLQKQLLMLDSAQQIHQKQIDSFLIISARLDKERISYL